MNGSGAAMSILMLIAAGPDAQTQPALPAGANIITGHIAASSGQALCGSGTVYLYESFPDISGADGGVRIPRFETPTADTPHQETACIDGAFTFTKVPDGNYIVGVPPKGGVGPVFDDMATVDGGKTVTIELKPEAVGRY